MIISKIYEKTGHTFVSLEEAEATLKADVSNIDDIISFLRQAFLDGLMLSRNLSLSNNKLRIDIKFIDQEAADTYFNNVPDGTAELISKGWIINTETTG